MKKSLSALIFSVIMIFSLVTTPVFAASIKEVKTELSGITAEVKAPAGTFENLDKSTIKATLDGVELSTDNAKLGNSSTEWIIMLDTSLSLSADHFTAEKSAIKAVYNSLGEDDKLSLYTFDTKTKEVLSGDESKEDAVKKIDAIKANGQDTAFYDAAVALANAAKSSNADSCVAIIYTDGVETLNKSDKSKAVEALKSSNIPVYGLYPDVTTAADSKELNSILSQSGGGAEAFTVKNASEKLKAYSSKADEIIELTFTAASDIEANEKATLSIDLGDGKSMTYNTAVAAYSIATQETTELTETAEEITEDTETTISSDDESGLNVTTIAIPVIAVLVIVLILVAVLKKKKPAKNNKKADKAEEIETPTPITEPEETSESTIEESVAEPEPQPELEPEIEEAPAIVEEIEETKEPAENEGHEEESKEESEAEEAHEETEEERLEREEKERRVAEAEKARVAALASAREKAAARAATIARAAKEARASAEAKAALEAEEKAKLESEEKAKAKAAKERAKKEKSAKKKMKEEGVQFYFVDK